MPSSTEVAYGSLDKSTNHTSWSKSKSKSKSSSEDSTDSARTRNRNACQCKSNSKDSKPATKAKECKACKSEDKPNRSKSGMNGRHDKDGKHKHTSRTQSTHRDAATTSYADAPPQNPVDQNHPHQGQLPYYPPQYTQGQFDNTITPWSVYSIPYNHGHHPLSITDRENSMHAQIRSIGY